MLQQPMANGAEEGAPFEGAPLAGVVVAVPYDMEAEALDTLEFGLPADALGNLGNVEGMPVFAYLFRTQARPFVRASGRNPAYLPPDALWSFPENASCKSGYLCALRSCWWSAAFGRHGKWGANRAVHQRALASPQRTAVPQGRAADPKSQNACSARLLRLPILPAQHSSTHGCSSPGSTCSGAR